MYLLDCLGEYGDRSGKSPKNFSIYMSILSSPDIGYIFFNLAGVCIMDGPGVVVVHVVVVAV